jgi:hypothetical protein
LEPFYTSSTHPLHHSFIIKNLIFIKKLSLMSHQRQLYNKNQFFNEKRVMKGDEWRMFSISQLIVPSIGPPSRTHQ